MAAKRTTLRRVPAKVIATVGTTKAVKKQFLSLRKEVALGVADLLKAEGMTCQVTQDGLVALVGTLSHYTEVPARNASRSRMVQPESSSAIMSSGVIPALSPKRTTFCTAWLSNSDSRAFHS